MESPRFWKTARTMAGFGFLFLVTCQGDPTTGPTPTEEDARPSGMGFISPAARPEAAVPAPRGELRPAAVPPGDFVFDFEGSGAGCVAGFPADFYAPAGLEILNAILAFETVPPGLCYNETDFPSRSPITVITAAVGTTITFNFAAATTRAGIHVNTIATPLTWSCFSAPDGGGAPVGSDVQATTACGSGSCTEGPNQELRVEGAGIRSCTLTGTFNAFGADDLFVTPVPGLGLEDSCEERVAAARATLDDLGGLAERLGDALLDAVEAGNQRAIGALLGVTRLLARFGLLDEPTEDFILSLVDICED